jgi:L-lactate dehydrogenase complex protein LldG
MSVTDRETFLGRIRASLKHDATRAPATPPPAVNESLARLTRRDEDLIEIFMKRATSVGMKPQKIQADELARKVHALIAEHEAKRVVVAAGTIPQALPLKEYLRRKELEVIDWAATPGLEALYGAEVAITDVYAAIAETGTIVCISDPGHSRGLTLVPPVHIALVRKSDLIPDMIDFWGRFKGTDPKSLPASIAMITGPSKSADIEGILVTGVHGPGVVHILVIEDV